MPEKLNLSSTERVVEDKTHDTLESVMESLATTPTVEGYNEVNASETLDLVELEKALEGASEAARVIMSRAVEIVDS